MNEEKEKKDRHVHKINTKKKIMPKKETKMLEINQIKK